MTKRSNNVATESAKTVKLLCGHTTDEFPIVTYASGRKMYRCPEGCGLIKSKR